MNKNKLEEDIKSIRSHSNLMENDDLIARLETLELAMKSSNIKTAVFDERNIDLFMDSWCCFYGLLQHHFYSLETLTTESKRILQDYDIDGRIFIENYQNIYLRFIGELYNMPNFFINQSTQNKLTNIYNILSGVVDHYMEYKDKELSHDLINKILKKSLPEDDFNKLIKEENFLEHCNPSNYIFFKQ